MTRFGFAVFCFIFINTLLSGKIQAQISIHGIITDCNGEKIENASIVDQKSQKGTVSDVLGGFELFLPQEDAYVLNISHIAHVKKQVKIQRKERSVVQINISLESEAVILEPVMITATKTERAIREIPGRAVYIKNEDIEKAASQKIDDVLARVSGINVSRTTGIYSMRPTVTLRALSGDEQGRTLVLIDGIPVNMADNGDVNWNRINVSDIDHIEIFKGPGSSLYGNNAMGGVINLISKKPKEGFTGRAEFSYGTYNTLKQKGQIMIREKDKFYLGLSQFYQKSDGFNNIPKEDRDDPDYSIKRNLEELGTAIKLGQDHRKWLNWEIQYDVYQDKRGEGQQILTPDGVYRQFNTRLLKGTLQGAQGQIQYQWSTYYQYQNYIDINENMRNNQYSRYDVDSDREDWGTLCNFTYKGLKYNTISSGFEFRNGSVDAGDYYQTPNFANAYDSVLNAGKMRSLAAYIQDEYTFFEEKIILAAGLRFDLVKFYDGDYYNSSPWNNKVPDLKENEWNEISPRLAFRFFPKSVISAYISYSHGFRASILDDLCRTGWMWVGPKYANPELGPEYLDNYEFGMDIRINKNLEFSPTIFYSRGKDFLYYIASGDSLFGRPVFQRQNVSEVEIRGAEIDVKARINQNIDFFANYTYNHAQISRFKERPELEKKHLTYTPQNSVKSGFFFECKYIHSNFVMNYKDMQFSTDDNSQILNSYVTFDFRLWADIKKYYQLGISIFDLFDNQHMETADYLSPGRLVYMDLNIKIQQ